LDDILRKSIVRKEEAEIETQDWVEVKNQLDMEWQANHSVLDQRSIADVLSNSFRARLMTPE
jgi:hypothetical protein